LAKSANANIIIIWKYRVRIRLSIRYNLYTFISLLLYWNSSIKVFLKWFGDCQEFNLLSERKYFNNKITKTFIIHFDLYFFILYICIKCEVIDDYGIAIVLDDTEPACTCIVSVLLTYNRHNIKFWFQRNPFYSVIFYIRVKWHITKFKALKVRILHRVPHKFLFIF